VPWDFTPVAENALEHAVKISRMVGDSISLLHIVDPGIKKNVLGEKKILLQHVADENGRKYNIKIFFSYSQRNYFYLHSRICQ
jgi:nucleotide-binding universal stress UspA family protein